MSLKHSKDYLDRREKWEHECWRFIGKAEYKKATKHAERGLEHFPNDNVVKFRYFATLADYALSKDTKEFRRMHTRAVKGMDSILKRPKGMDSANLYTLKNEFYFQTKQYKKQYQLGINAAKRMDARKPFYSAGVGAAHYALELAFKNRKKSSQNWALKSVSAWENYFRFDKKYYNPYVHLALAHGILGNHKKMMSALKKSSRLCLKPLDYEEFSWVQTSVSKIPFLGKGK